METMEKLADNHHPINDLIRARWSPRAFSTRPVEPEVLRSLFEAARWAPSSMNAQPWAFLTAALDRQPEAHARLVETLGENNRRWASNAPVLVLALAKTEREPGQANRTASYDLGQAVALLSLQATELGIYVHQMGGFNLALARELFAIPPEYEPWVVLAIGYPGEVDTLPEDMRQRELSGRLRKPQDEFVFTGEWGQSS
jgi:nitroreductase